MRFFIISILLAMSTAYGAAVPLLGLNLGIGANIGLGPGDRGSHNMYHSGYREEEGAGIGVGIGAGIGLGLL